MEDLATHQPVAEGRPFAARYRRRSGVGIKKNAWGLHPYSTGRSSLVPAGSTKLPTPCVKPAEGMSRIRLYGFHHHLAYCVACW